MRKTLQLVLLAILILSGHILASSSSHGDMDDATPRARAASSWMNRHGVKYDYNIECNCIGTLLIEYGRRQAGRKLLNTDTLHLIDRYASLGHAPFGKTVRYTVWTLSIVIPFKYLPHLNDDGTRTDYVGNIFKYGKRLHAVYYISLFPVHTQTVGFHRPEYFQPLFP